MRKSYSSDAITVSFDPRLCIHAARCVAGAPEVFDPNARPWIRPENAGADKLADVVARCPTGALRYECAGDREALAYDAQQRWLKLFGKDLQSAFGLDAFTLRIRTMCLPY